MTSGSDPVVVFNHMNRFLCEHAEVGRYATMFFGILSRDGELVFFNAGHPSPLIIREGKVTELYTKGSLPVGLVPEAEFTADTVNLQPSDTLILFSDGVTEAADPEEQLYGVPRLQEVLSGKHDVPLEELQKSILESVLAFTRGADQADDITVLLLRYRAAAAGASS
jgi:sigma-B regulation protein RsbU (phosphoserine phosphatase)